MGRKPHSKKYYVGDLCYVLDDTTYEDLFGQVQGDSLVTGKFVTVKDGRKFFLGSTAYGDGGYLGSDGQEYCVDSGTIGIAALEDICLEEKFQHRVPTNVDHPRAGKLYHESLGHIHDMPIKSFEKSTSQGGWFKLGEITIVTE